MRFSTIVDPLPLICRHRGAFKTASNRKPSLKIDRNGARVQELLDKATRALVESTLASVVHPPGGTMVSLGRASSPGDVSNRGRKTRRVFV